MKHLIVAILAMLVLMLPVAAQDDPSANIRVAHFSVDAPAVDIYVNGEVAIAGLDFPEVTDWMKMPVGTYSIAVAPAGTSLSQAVIGPADFEFADGEWLTIAAIGEVGAGNLQVTVLPEEYDTTADAETRLSIFHGVWGLSPINLSVNGNSLVNLLPFPGTVFPGSDGFATRDVVAATYDIEVTLEDGSEVATLNDVTMGYNRHYFLAVVGVLTNPQFVFVVTDMSNPYGETVTETLDETAFGTGPLMARVAHFSVDAPAVDIYLNGTLAVGDLSYPDVTDYLELSGGVYDVAIVPAGGALADAVFEGQIGLREGSTTTIAAVGVLDLNSLNVVTFQENPELAGRGEAMVGIFNAVAGTDSVDLLIDDQVALGNLFYPVAFGESAGSGYAALDLIAGNYSLAVSFDNSEVALDLGSIQMGVGRYYFIAVIGIPSAPNYILLPMDITDMR